ncbi:hypothetical protein [Sphingomonas bacterium]|uniref:hypothetical protein n=1 Tax=Sphingomonas bacterium TaxID=1895847 RepID=UPI0015768876|nr:hypothetical protein [Sphingomonas bacterium]
MVLILLAAAASDARAADYARYPAAIVRHLRPVSPPLTDARLRENRTALRAAARQRPDFAGHWVLATIGCGASCIQPAALDRLTGRVVWFPATLCCWPLTVSEPLSYRINSRLLVVEGDLNEQEPSRIRRYVFDGRRFAPLPD